MEKLFVSIIFMSGYVLLLCLGAGLQILGSKAFHKFRLYQDRKSAKKSQERANKRFERYDIQLNKPENV